MSIRRLILVLLILTFTTACGGQSTPTVAPEVLITPTQVLDTPTEVQDGNISVEKPTAQVETAEPACLGGEISPIGQSIAGDYESASYEQVMTWFCNGAEFEDILVALETEAQTDTSADEMLKMLADGFTWEEIWQLVGLTN